MLPGPILRREIKAASSGRGWFMTRSALALALGAVVVLPLFSDRADAADPESLHRLAPGFFAIAIGLELLVLAPLAAVSAGVSIAEEREKDTLSQLLLTRLSRLELAATKLTGRLLPTLLPAIAGLPFLLVSGWWGGLSLRLAALIVAAFVSTLAVAASFGVLGSSRRERSSSGRIEAVGWTIGWLVGVPLMSRLPASSGTLWSDLLVEIRRLCGWLAPSSPLSLLTDASWVGGGGAVGAALAERLLWMIGLQAPLIALALAGVVASLRLREPHPREWDAYGGYRPPVDDDDPIYWREYVLPTRGGQRPLVLTYLRMLWIMLRALLMILLQMVFLLILVAMIGGVLYFTAWYGWAAFQERWMGRSFPGGPYASRDQLNMFMRLMTFFLGLSPAAATVATLSTKIRTEHDKKTWEALLTTPLTGREILGSKTRAIVRGLRRLGGCLIILWCLGIACDALHPLGAAVAGLGCASVGLFGLGLGARLALKPEATSQNVNSAAALWMIALMGAGGLTIVAPLCSARQFQALGSYNPWLPWWAAVFVAVAITAMAAIGRTLIRSNFERFDEWVGRPRRAETPASAPTPAALPLLDPDAVG